MFARALLALVVGLTPMRALAEEAPSTEKLAQQATAFAARARRSEDPTDAAVAALQAHNVWREAHRVDGDEQHLCAAKALLAEVCGREDLEPAHRASLERRRDALSGIKCPTSTRPPAAEPRPPTRGQSTRPAHTDDDARRIPERPEPAPSLVQVDLRPAPEPAASRAASSAASLAASPVPASSPAAVDRGSASPAPVRTKPAPAHASDPDHGPTLDDHPAPKTHRPLTIAGGISLGLGLVALGVMTPFAARDVAIAREVDELAAIKNTAGGHLSPDEEARLGALRAESHRVFPAALALGIAGGVATLAGASLMIIETRGRRRRRLALHPAFAPGGAALTLQGRF